MSGEFGQYQIMSHDSIEITYDQFMAGEVGGETGRGLRWPSFLLVDIHQSPMSAADIYEPAPETFMSRLGKRYRSLAQSVRAKYQSRQLRRSSR